jgi:hypothetical protein
LLIPATEVGSSQSGLAASESRRAIPTTLMVHAWQDRGAANSHESAQADGRPPDHSTHKKHLQDDRTGVNTSWRLRPMSKRAAQMILSSNIASSRVPGPSSANRPLSLSQHRGRLEVGRNAQRNGGEHTPRPRARQHEFDVPRLAASRTGARYATLAREI